MEIECPPNTAKKKKPFPEYKSSKKTLQLLWWRMDLQWNHCQVYAIIIDSSSHIRHSVKKKMFLSSSFCKRAFDVCLHEISSILFNSQRSLSPSHLSNYDRSNSSSILSQCSTSWICNSLDASRFPNTSLFHSLILNFNHCNFLDSLKPVWPWNLACDHYT